MRWPSSFASNESPGWRFSLRRIRLGTTTCPFVETLVSMVRQSYPKPLQITRKTAPLERLLPNSGWIVTRAQFRSPGSPYLCRFAKMVARSRASSFWKLGWSASIPAERPHRLALPQSNRPHAMSPRIKARWASRNVSACTEVIATNLAFIGVGLKGFVSIAEKGFASTPLSDRITALSTRF